MMKLTEQDKRNARDFLLQREADISIEIDDFGLLKGIFKYTFQREPKH